MRRDEIRAATLPGGLLAVALLLAACATGPASPGPALPAAPPPAERTTEARLARRARAAAAPAATDRDHLAYVAALVSAGRASEARRVYEGRAARPGATDVERTLAERLRTDGSATSLRRVYGAAEARTPTSPWWPLALAELDLADADAARARRDDLADRGDRDGERRAHAEAHEALRRAEVHVGRAARVAPDLAEVDLFRGYLRAAEGDLAVAKSSEQAAWRAAAEAFRRATTRGPDLVAAWEGLGDVLLRLGETDDALAPLLVATQASPDDETLRLLLGTALERAERPDEAAVHYEQAAALAPRDPAPWLRLGDARAEAKRYDLALTAYDAALARDGHALEAHLKSGAVLELLGRRGEALAAYQRYLSQGGEETADVKRRIERLLREEDAP